MNIITSDFARRSPTGCWSLTSRAYRADGAGARASSPVGVKLLEQYCVKERPELIKRILVVEDNSIFHRHWNKYCEKFVGEGKFQLQVVAPTTTQDLLALVSKEEFDMIVMDHDLEDSATENITGTTLTKALRESNFTGYIIAASMLDEKNAEMINAGADLAVNKGVESFAVKVLFGLK
jgi:CheY-like chemotaxis protein